MMITQKTGNDLVMNYLYIHFTFYIYTPLLLALVERKRMNQTIFRRHISSKVIEIKTNFNMMKKKIIKPFDNHQNDDMITTH